MICLQKLHDTMVQKNTIARTLLFGFLFWGGVEGCLCLLVCISLGFEDTPFPCAFLLWSS